MMKDSIGRAFQKILDLSDDQVSRLDKIFISYMRGATFQRQEDYSENKHKIIHFRKGLNVLSEKQRNKFFDKRRTKKSTDKESKMKRESRIHDHYVARFSTLNLSDSELRRVIEISKQVDEEVKVKRREQIKEGFPFDFEDHRRKRNYELISQELSKTQMEEYDKIIKKEKANWLEYKKKRLKSKHESLNLTDEQATALEIFQHDKSLNYHLERSKSKTEKRAEENLFFKKILSKEQFDIYAEEQKKIEEKEISQRKSNIEKNEVRYLKKLKREEERFKFFKKEILPIKYKLSERLHSVMTENDKKEIASLRKKFEEEMIKRSERSIKKLKNEYGNDGPNILKCSALQSAMMVLQPSPIYFDTKFDFENNYPFSDQILLNESEKRQMEDLHKKIIHQMMTEFESSGGSYTNVFWMEEDKIKGTPQRGYEYQLLLLGPSEEETFVFMQKVIDVYETGYQIKMN